MKALIRSLAVMLFAFVCSAQSQTSDLNTQIEHMVRFTYHVPSEVKILVGPKTTSEFPNWDALTVLFETPDGKKRDYNFLLSKDAKTLVRLVKIDLRGDADSNTISRDQSKLSRWSEWQSDPKHNEISVRSICSTDESTPPWNVDIKNNSQSRVRLVFRAGDVATALKHQAFSVPAGSTAFLQLIKPKHCNESPDLKFDVFKMPDDEKWLTVSFKEGKVTSKGQGASGGILSAVLSGLAQSQGGGAVTPSDDEAATGEKDSSQPQETNSHQSAQTVPQNPHTVPPRAEQRSSMSPPVAVYEMPSAGRPPVTFDNACIQIVDKSKNNNYCQGQPAYVVKFKNVCSSRIVWKMCTQQTSGWQCGGAYLNPGETGSNGIICNATGEVKWWAIPNGQINDLPADLH